MKNEHIHYGKAKKDYKKNRPEREFSVTTALIILFIVIIFRSHKFEEFVGIVVIIFFVFIVQVLIFCHRFNILIKYLFFHKKNSKVEN